jgi:hypothetical protein
MVEWIFGRLRGVGGCQVILFIVTAHIDKVANTPDPEIRVFTLAPQLRKHILDRKLAFVT